MDDSRKTVVCVGDAVVARYGDAPILRDRAEDDGEPPKALRVVDFTPQGHATPLFGIVADYGWAERILFSDAYEQDARDIACALGDRLGIEVTG